MQQIIEHLTICSFCGSLIDEQSIINRDKKYLLCKCKHGFVPRGANSWNEFSKERNMHNMKQQKEVKTMAKSEEENAVKPAKVKKEGNFGKSTTCKCSKCGKDKFARKEIYDARVVKAGSEKKMLATYLCRECKRADKVE